MFFHTDLQSRSSSDSSGRPDFMSSHLLSPDHAIGPLPETDLYEISPSDSIPEPGIMEHPLPANSPAAWLPPGFVPDA